MLKNLVTRTTILLLSFTSLPSCASGVKWEGKIERHIYNYEKAFTTFRTAVCGPKTEESFNNKLIAYRGQGYWIPELNGDVDVETIKDLLPTMEKKLAWIRNEKSKLEKNKKFPSKKVTEDLRKSFKEILDLKKSELADDYNLKQLNRQKAVVLVQKIQQQYDKLVKDLSFFSNFNFPNDHLFNRRQYDQHKGSKSLVSQKIANHTFLLRKTLEDGAYDKNHKSWDMFFRTTLDTLYFDLRKSDFYLSENARYDLDFILDRVESELAKGRDFAIERFTEWEERMTKTVSFYTTLTLPEHNKLTLINGQRTTLNRELIKEHNEAQESLKEFVYQKQADVYDFWLKQSELNRAIFTLETILMNEVGGVDGKSGLERMDVARVVLTRLDRPEYLKIGKKEFIYPHLIQKVSQEKINKETWLNALFKQGEFSFTYYYMSGSRHIFCPDMAPGAKRLRAQNIRIALNALKEESSDFKATRYFSRASMTGRISMDSIWDDYVPFPERPGLMVTQQANLQKKWDAGDFYYLYSFVGPDKLSYRVIQIAKKTYVVGLPQGTPVFYHYRNPHYFRYFTKLVSQ
ncbi:MAG TPA: hypothetical protein VKZ84_02465 [Bacteriovoracaceae bacterium]|nr:hypothetical protein [Bacteriovoracaceae bacterium]